MKKIRCAIYTRKSSEEGLEQDFNSLHAQREACEAFILSQKHEGWQLLPELYDDGGFSGGNINRPALQYLFDRIDDGQVDVIVVYKVDRLTRSLADFAKLVERMDAKGVSFVSVTQQFNTTSSMGRLTLNVLLSFAQFEREVTGERIRDKIAMSKQKGKWMGGTVPTGYEFKERRLLISEPDALLIRLIFDRYLELKSVNLLKAELDAQERYTKVRVSKTEKQSGGLPFTKSNLYRILQNRVYIGQIVHKDKYYDGEHEAIISLDTFDKVQALIAQTRTRQLNSIGAKSPCLLAGRVFDDKGFYMTPKHSRTRKRHYRYYTSQAIIQSRHDEAGSLPNVPAHELEMTVKNEVYDFLRDTQKLQSYLANESIDQQLSLLKTAAQWSANSETERLFLRSFIARIEVSDGTIKVIICSTSLLKALRGHLDGLAPSEPEQLITLKRQMKLVPANNGSKVIVGSKMPETSSILVKAIVKSHLWNQQLISGEARTVKEITSKYKLAPSSYTRKLMHLRFLAPDITEAILSGKNSRHLTFDKLAKIARIHSWDEQRKAIGF